jgi:hypothetical protein
MASRSLSGESRVAGGNRARTESAICRLARDPERFPQAERRPVLLIWHSDRRPECPQGIVDRSRGQGSAP